MGSKKAFFVYGTLKTGECREHVFNNVLGHNNFTRTPAIIKGDLYDLGPFPGICSGDGNVVGELVMMSEEDYYEVLPALDQIEGYEPGRDDNLYVRKEVLLVGTLLPIKATTYFFANKDELKDDGRRVVSGIWSTFKESS